MKNIATNKPWYVSHLNVEGCDCGVCAAEAYAETVESSKDRQTKVFLRELDELGIGFDEIVTMGDLADSIYR